MARFTCTVAVPHVDTPHLLRCCLANIQHYLHPDIAVDVIVIDQSQPAIKAAVKMEWDGKSDANGRTPIKVIDAPRVDAGYPLDVAVKEATGEYFCSMDCDCWPITPAWLAIPIEQIKRYGLSFVGCDCDLHKAYPHLGPAPVINNFFRVSRTDIAHEASDRVGFMRPQNRKAAGFPSEFPHGGWHDNGVAANWCVNTHHPELRPLGLPVTRHLGNAHDRDDCCVYGIIVGELVFHLGYGFHPDTVRDAVKQLGQKFLDLHDSFAHKDNLVEYARELEQRSVKYAFVGW